MENKNVGWLIIGIFIIIEIIILLFNFGINSFLDQTCSHGASCTMYETLKLQTYLSHTIAGIILIIGLFLIFTKEKIIIKKIKEKSKKKKIDISNLNEKEKEVIRILQKENGGIFQADLKEKLKIGKVGLTRLLDKLESKELIERKRRGMNNFVILKN
jgi:uncharacterized membrane protein